jgi:hypothetical protein
VEFLAGSDFFNKIVVETLGKLVNPGVRWRFSPLQNQVALGIVASADALLCCFPFNFSVNVSTT